MATATTNQMEPKKFFTAMENCYVKRPDNTPQYISYKKRPICVENLYTKPVCDNPDGSYTMWVPDYGYVKHVAVNGTITEWFQRPTIQDIVDNSLKTSGEGWCTIFKKDGSVYETAQYGRWFWGALTVEAVPLPVHYDAAAQGDSDYNDCGCGLDYRCCGWYPPHEDQF